MPQGDVIVGGSVSANSTSQTAPAPNSTANFNASGVSGGSLQVTGTFVGTLVPEGSLTGAPGDWQAAPITNLAGAPVTSITAPGFFTFNAETFVFFRLRSTAWTSGIAAVVFKASPGAGPSGGGGGGGGASTIADGADVAEGATTDAKVTLDNAGTVSAKLRGLLYEFGDQADAAATTDAGTFSFVAFVKRLLSRLTTLLPQTANGLKVDNSAVTQPVSAASLPLPTGAAADATLGTTNTEIGGLTETAPATDTASSGLNGRLQRMAQRMTSLIALLPASLVGGRLDVNIGATGVTQGVSGTVTASQGTQGAGGTASWPVQGAAAAGAALAGNPVLQGASDGANVQNLTVVSAAQPLLKVALYSSAGLAIGATNGFADADANGLNGAYAVARGQSYNGANWDRFRNNVDVTLLASAARTTTQSGTITTYNLGAIKFILDMTTVGTGSVTLTISETDLASGKTILLLSGAAVITNVTNEYTVDPMVPAVANVSAQKRIPRTVFWQVTANNANSASYSLGSMQLPA